VEKRKRENEKARKGKKEKNPIIISIFRKEERKASQFPYLTKRNCESAC
jgi:hypothetical protein